MTRHWLAWAVLSLFAGVQAPDNRDGPQIYAAVLKFFKPHGDQVRWIDPRLIAPETGSLQALSSGLLDSLVQLAGRRFEVLKPGLEAESRSGGVVRLSEITRFTPDSAAVFVRYRHHTPYHSYPEVDLSFLVVKRKAKWTLLRQ